MRFAKAFIGTQVLSDAPQTEGLQVCGSKKAFAPVGAFFPKAFFFAEKKAFACAAPAVALRSLSLGVGANRVCFPGGSCLAYIDRNGTALVFKAS